MSLIGGWILSIAPSARNIWYKAIIIIRTKVNSKGIDCDIYIELMESYPRFETFNI